MSQTGRLTRTALAVLCVSAVAHLSNAQQPAKPKAGEQNELTVAPNAPQSQPEAITPDARTANSGRPANICQELVAHLIKVTASATQPDPSKATATSAGKQPPANQAPFNQSPSGGSAPTSAAQHVDKAQQSSGYSAPVPGSEKPSTPAVISVDDAQALAQQNNLRGCQTAVAKMRRAGVALPSGLLALGALREDLLLASEPPPGNPSTTPAKK